jgi:ubiquitin-conjugating enzyme E2 D/E
MDPKQLKRWPKAMLKKFQNAQQSNEFRIVQANEDKLDLFYILLQPTGGYYKGQTYILEMRTQHDNKYLYPFTAPLIKFVNQIWHPNISVNGSICLDILKDPTKWSPQNGIETIISCIILLMDDPENSSPFNGQAAILFRTCEKKYKEMTDGIKMKHDDQVKIQEDCFKPFCDKTESFAGKNIDKYMKYFETTEILDLKIAELKLTESTSKD